MDCCEGDPGSALNSDFHFHALVADGVCTCSSPFRRTFFHLARPLEDEAVEEESRGHPLQLAPPLGTALIRRRASAHAHQHADLGPEAPPSPTGKTRSPGHPLRSSATLQGFRARESHPALLAPSDRDGSLGSTTGVRSSMALRSSRARKSSPALLRPSEPGESLGGIGLPVLSPGELFVGKVSASMLGDFQSGSFPHGVPCSSTSERWAEVHYSDFTTTGLV
jgi:hypothetical protein